MAPSSKSSRSGTPAATTDDAMARLSSPVDGDHHNDNGAAAQDAAERLELRRGPWTVDEDLALVNYITDHGEGRWNSLAQAAGTCLSIPPLLFSLLANYTVNKLVWSKIAQHLPGRTDNEIKNYWRTRVQKHAKQLNCDANSKRFKDAMRYLWMPHLVDVDHRRRLCLHQDGGYYAALSGMGVTSSSSADSFATTTSESYDAFPAAKKWEASYDDGGIYANVRAGETMLVSDDGGDWVQEMNQAGLWPAAAEQKAVHGAGQFEDPELSGWVQSFSEGVNENFWTLEDIWKMQ
ncbi:hypothetical protein PR202_ga12162 [Eleusine coracana subsp. coracana]|uniref:MYB transcription factor n=1 Tax=Eleusine coracana subsp. coracana TaxID=191504 RepID=A0AAV5CBC2_ELECO|nr:hypothetical protein PR202_ga12162 [Eleusine coracana subsp. coracana]